MRRVAIGMLQEREGDCRDARGRSQLSCCNKGQAGVMLQEREGSGHITTAGGRLLCCKREAAVVLQERGGCCIATAGGGLLCCKKEAAVVLQQWEGDCCVARERRLSYCKREAAVVLQERGGCRIARERRLSYCKIGNSRQEASPNKLQVNAVNYTTAIGAKHAMTVFKCIAKNFQNLVENNRCAYNKHGDCGAQLRVARLMCFIAMDCAATINP